MGPFTLSSPPPKPMEHTESIGTDEQRGRAILAGLMTWKRDRQQSILAHFIGPHREALQSAGAEGSQERHVGGVVTVGHQDPADARHVVTRVESIPTTVQVRFKPSAEILVPSPAPRYRRDSRCNTAPVCLGSGRARVS